MKDSFFFIKTNYFYTKGSRSNLWTTSYCNSIRMCLLTNARSILSSRITQSQTLQW